MDLKKPFHAALVLASAALLSPAWSAAGGEATSLVVVTREVPPFAMQEDGHWEGIAIELWSRIAEQLDLDYELREAGLGEMLQLVEAGDADVAAAALTITSDRETRLDFSHPFHTSGLGVVVNQKPGGGWLAALSRVFSERFLKALAPLLLLLTIVGVLVWLVERRRNPQFQGNSLPGIGSGLWWSAVTMTTVGYGDKAPLSFAGRLIAIVWMFASVIVISSLTATIASALTVGELEQPIAGVDDLYQARVLTLPDTTSDGFLNERLIRHGSAPSLEDALDALERDETDAVVYDAPILRYLVTEHHPATLRVLPQVFQRQDYGFALPQGSPLREEINRELLMVIRSPEWQRFLERFLGRDA
jgi:ABC-type amino acid transport substrate-binding protein